KAVTSNDEAFHGVLLYIDNKDESSSYGQRVSTLKGRQMLPGNFDEPADAPIRRGTLAVALVRAMKIHGGLTMNVVGPLPRYAVRELQFAGLYPPSTPNQSFSGAEFVGIIGR